MNPHATPLGGADKSMCTTWNEKVLHHCLSSSYPQQWLDLKVQSYASAYIVPFFFLSLKHHMCIILYLPAIIWVFSYFSTNKKKDQKKVHLVLNLFQNEKGSTLFSELFSFLTEHYYIGSFLCEIPLWRQIKKMDFPHLPDSSAPFPSAVSQASHPAPWLSIPDGTFDIDKYQQ